MSGKDTEQTERGVVSKLRDSMVDIAVVPGDGDDVFIKAGGDVLLLDEMEARTLAEEIQVKLDPDYKEVYGRIPGRCRGCERENVLAIRYEDGVKCKDCGTEVDL